MNNKLFLVALLLCSMYCTPLMFADNFNVEDWQLVSTATGNTTGHIGDLMITNKTKKVNTISLGSYLIPPQNERQGYAVFKKEMEQIEVEASDTYTHQLYGYCIKVDLTPATEGEAFPEYLEWLPAKNFDTAFAAQWNQSEGTVETLNFNSQLAQAAPIIIGAVKQLEDQYKTWGRKEIVQRAVWQFTSALQGKPYIFQQFEESILKQDHIKDWLNSNGDKYVTIANLRLVNKTYFNYQCQKLWSIVTELNFLVNPVSEKLLPA